MSTDSLYTPNDPVIILTDNDFVVDGNNNATLNNDMFMGAGIIKAYAPWCPHCKDKVDEIKCLGKVLQENATYGVQLYVFNADNAENMQNAKADQVSATLPRDPLIAGFPTFLYVGTDRSVHRLKVQINNTHKDANSVEESIMGLCTEQNMCKLEYKAVVKCGASAQQPQKTQQKQPNQVGGQWW